MRKTKFRRNLFNQLQLVGLVERSTNALFNFNLTRGEVLQINEAKPNYAKANREATNQGLVDDAITFVQVL